MVSQAPPLTEKGRTEASPLSLCPETEITLSAKQDPHAVMWEMLLPHSVLLQTCARPSVYLPRQTQAGLSLKAFFTHVRQCSLSQNTKTAEQNHLLNWLGLFFLVSHRHIINPLLWRYKKKCIVFIIDNLFFLLLLRKCWKTIWSMSVWRIANAFCSQGCPQPELSQLSLSDEEAGSSLPRMKIHSPVVIKPGICFISSKTFFATVFYFWNLGLHPKIQHLLFPELSGFQPSSFAQGSCWFA